MYVIYHSSDLFADVTGVSMLSLFENNKKMGHIHVLYIERGISKENKEKLLSIADQYGRELEFMQMPDWSEKLNIHLRSSKKGWLGFGYNRLFLTDYLPEYVEKVLYLDSDTLIEQPLDELWDTDLEKYYLAGVDDCLSSKYRALVGLGIEGIYVNSGVLLINVKRWREENVCQKFVDMVVNNNGFFIFNEQSAINSMFCGRIKILPQNYNVNSMVYLYNYEELMKLRKPCHYSYTREELLDARKHPVITHYTGNFYVRRRPWFWDSDHPHADTFLKYRAMTPWKDCPCAIDTRGWREKFWTELCHFLPKAVMLDMVSILYNDLRPIALRRRIKKERR